MDYLDKARKSMDLIMRHVKANDISPVEMQMALLTAQVDAAIAQAEALERIAKSLENWMSVQGVLPEFFEYIERHKIREAVGHTEQIHSE